MGGHLGLSIQMVQNLTQYHISEYRLNLITSHLSDTQGITRTAIRVFCRLTARWVMGSYFLSLSKGQMMNGSAHRQRPDTNKRHFHDG